MQMQLEDRIQKLERDNRLIKRAVTVALVVIAAAGAMGATSNCWNSCVQSQSFVLVDSCGVRRADLTLEDGQPRLKMYAEDGKSALIQLGINSLQNTDFRMRGKDGFGIAGIYVAPDQQTFELAGSRRIRLEQRSIGGPVLELNHTGSARIEIGALNFDWIFRTFNASGVVTELHKVPI